MQCFCLAAAHMLITQSWYNHHHPACVSTRMHGISPCCPHVVSAPRITHHDVNFHAGTQLWVKLRGMCHWPVVMWSMELCMKKDVPQLLTSFKEGLHKVSSCLSNTYATTRSSASPLGYARHAVTTQAVPMVLSLCTGCANCTVTLHRGSITCS